MRDLPFFIFNEEQKYQKFIFKNGEYENCEFKPLVCIYV